MELTMNKPEYRVEAIGKNQFIIHTRQGQYLQSYNSLIVFLSDTPEVKTQLGKNWKYSSTTSTHRSRFLGETTATTQKKLDSGEYVLNPSL